MQFQHSPSNLLFLNHHLSQPPPLQSSVAAESTPRDPPTSQLESMSEGQEPSNPASTPTNNTGGGQGGYLNTSDGTNSPLCFGGTSNYPNGGYQFSLGAPLDAVPLKYTPSRRELHHLKQQLKTELNVLNAEIAAEDELDEWHTQHPDGNTAGSSGVAAGNTSVCSSCKKSKKKCSRRTTGISPCTNCKTQNCRCD